MKKYFVFLSIVILTILLFNSCTVLKSTNSTVKTMDVYGSGVMHLPVVVELVVSDTKVSATIENSSSAMSVANMKTDAILKAVSSANADVLVEPSFVVETTGYDKKVTVTGFPATYDNFRTIKHEDIDLLQVGVLQVADVSQTKTVERQKAQVSKTGLIATALAIGTAVIIAIIAF